MEVNKSIFKAHVKGVLFALIATLVAVLVFALLIKLVGFSGVTIKAVTQAIKVLSIFVGVFVVVRHIEKRAWLHGAIVGLIYTVLVFFIFSIVDRSFDITGGLFIDTFFALVIGVICAMLLRFRKRDTLAS